MVIGIGTDIIEISRIRNACKRKAFFERVFTEQEIAYFNQKNDSFDSVAATFCAKEAAVKALGTGFSGFFIRDIEIFHDELGRPYVDFLGGARNIYLKIGGTSVHLTLSHCKDYAVAFVIISG